MSTVNNTAKGSDTMPTASRTIPDASPVMRLEGKKLGSLNADIQEMPELQHLTASLPKPTASTVPYAALVSNPNNPRSAEHVSDNATDLLPSIRLEGLKTPLVVEQHSNGKYLILQGESRYVAIGRGIKDKTLPKALTDNVPCVIYSGLTVSQRESLINDHGTSKGLTRPETTNRSANKKSRLSCGVPYCNHVASPQRLRRCGPPLRPSTRQAVRRLQRLAGTFSGKH
jgi:hypothetical protein